MPYYRKHKLTERLKFTNEPNVIRKFLQPRVETDKTNSVRWCLSGVRTALVPQRERVSEIVRFDIGRCVSGSQEVSKVKHVTYQESDNTCPAFQHVAAVVLCCAVLGTCQAPPIRSNQQDQYAPVTSGYTHSHEPE